MAAFLTYDFNGLLRLEWRFERKADCYLWAMG